MPGHPQPPIKPIPGGNVSNVPVTGRTDGNSVGWHIVIPVPRLPVVPLFRSTSTHPTNRSLTAVARPPQNSIIHLWGHIPTTPWFLPHG